MLFNTPQGSWRSIATAQTRSRVDVASVMGEAFPYMGEAFPSLDRRLPTLTDHDSASGFRWKTTTVVWPS